MKYVAVVLLLASTQYSIAQQLASLNYNSSSQHDGVSAASSVNTTLKDYLPGERMRNTGRTLTILGAGLFMGGIIVASNADDYSYSANYTSNGSYEEGDPKGALGVVMITGGAGMMVPGIIFWSKGARKMKADPSAMVARFQVRSNGVSIRYTF